MTNLTATSLVRGGKYNWKNQPERLVYLGLKGQWHQFALVENIKVVWCEVHDSNLKSIEVTQCID
jgi:hypothetical protein